MPIPLNVLVTGGAGFIGRHLVRRLLREGCAVTVLDNFSPQIHGDIRALPCDIAHDVMLHTGDVRDESLVSRVVHGQDVVVHLAAETGTGQSMYEILSYEEVNIRGTAIMVQSLVNDATERQRKLIVASSRAVYGEGKYLCPAHQNVYPHQRVRDDMLRGNFEPRCPICGCFCESIPTTEDAPFQACSFYGLTKQVQEQMVLLFAKTGRFSGIALRYQNVYGPEQSLKNPYTGILAIFSKQARLNEPINVFEDGLESRDFVYVEDVVDATWRCIISEDVRSEVLNVGSGSRITVSELVRDILSFFRSQSTVQVSGAFREGDIRHNSADLSKAKKLIGFQPCWKFTDGLPRFLEWAAREELGSTGYERSLAEMRQRGLLYG